MRLRLILFAVVLAIGLPSPSVAETTDLQVSADKSFKHGPSGIVLAASATGIPRTRISSYHKQQLDVAAEYRTADGKEVTTVFIFRKVTGDVPLWFDRIQRTVEARAELQSPRLVIAPAAFTPLGQPNARGLKATYAGGPASGWPSSAAALTSVGDWFVALRLSSATLTPQELNARLDQTFAAIRWPREKGAPAPNAYLVSDCANALAQGPDAEPASGDGASVLMSALVGSVAESEDKAVAVKPPRWCRDPAITDGAGIYRPDGATNSYLVAFQDAGRGIVVQPNGLAGILAGPNAPATYSVEWVQIDSRSGLGSFKTLPTFAQAVWLVDHGKALYKTTTWGKNRDVQIDSDAVK